MEKIYTVNEAAEYLRISSYTLRELLATGKLRGFVASTKLRQHWRVPESALIEYVNASVELKKTIAKAG